MFLLKRVLKTNKKNSLSPVYRIYIGCRAGLQNKSSPRLQCQVSPDRCIQHQGHHLLRAQQMKNMLLLNMVWYKIWWLLIVQVERENEKAVVLQWWDVTKYLLQYFTYLRYLYFTWVFTFHATLYFTPLQFRDKYCNLLFVVNLFIFVYFTD